MPDQGGDAGKVVLAGGNGVLGTRLARWLGAQGWEVVTLTRSPRLNSESRKGLWDAKTVGPWAEELEGSVVINLAGKLVDCRPTARNIALLTSSRVDSTLALRAAAEHLDHVPPVWIQMSTTAIYGDGGDAILDESSAPVHPLPQMTGVAEPWEAAVAGAPADRLVVLRTSIVLDRETPALDHLSAVVRMFLAGRVGSGRQWLSWIHIDDFIGIVHFLLGEPTIEGIVHATSPNPVRNAEFMAQLRHVLHRPPVPPTPALVVRMGAAVLRSDPALALTGRRAIPRRLLEADFSFRHPQLDETLASLFG